MKRAAGLSAVVFGAIALLGAIVTFWAGPFAPQPAFEDVVAETAINIRDAAIRSMRGEDPPPPKRPEWNIDKTLQVAVSTAGALAIILALVGFIREEKRRPLIAGFGLGAGAVAFQFISWFALVLVFAILVAAVLNSFGDFLSIG